MSFAAWAKERHEEKHVLSGRITYDGQIGAGSKFSLETLSGGIEVLLPANAAFELDAETFSGHVNSDFPITMQGTPPGICSSFTIPREKL